jgi:hypothetical protein
LRANKEQALLWRQLTTIALDAPLSHATFHRGQADGAALIGLCESLRFGPLTRRRLQEASGVQTSVTVAG